MKTKKAPKRGKIVESVLRLSIKIFLTAGALASSCVMTQPQQEFLVMSYNVQNLFDDRSDGTEYREYDPVAGVWTNDDYTAKLKAVSRVVESVSLQGPDILALQEIENPRVLDDLLATGGFEYSWKLMVPVQEAAVNTALLSRLPIERVHIHELSRCDGHVVRPVVEVEIRAGRGLLVVFVNHWKSKSGGQEQTEPWRLEAAAVIAKRLAYWQDAEPRADILVLGDFNEQGFNRFPNDRSSHQAILHEQSRFGEGEVFQGILTTGNRNSSLFQAQQSLFDPYYEKPEENPGSYVFQGQWLGYDKILMNNGLFDGQGLGYVEGSFQVVKSDFLLNHEGFPLFWQRSARKGFSDHLPVIARFYLESDGGSEIILTR